VRIIRSAHTLSYAFIAAVAGLFLSGCQGTDSAHLPLLEVDTDPIHLTKDNQSAVVELRNVGDDILSWWVYDKPDWAIIADLRGEIAEGDSALIRVIGDLSIGVGQYADSIEIRSDGGNAVLQLLMDVDITVPENGEYSGTTSEGLRIAYCIEYNEVLNFQGFYYTEGEVMVEHIPFFGEIQYSDTSFTVGGDHDFSLTGVYDGGNSIGGTWTLADNRLLRYSVIRED